jgi:hypothetical protein
MSFIAELKQIIYDTPIITKTGRNKVAHFCDHNGICIQFTRARSIWHAVAPSAIRPWWLVLEPVRRTKRLIKNNTQNE